MSNETKTLGFAVKTTTLGVSPSEFRWTGGPGVAVDETGAVYEPVVHRMGNIKKSIANAMNPIVGVDNVSFSVFNRHGEFYDFVAGRGTFQRAEVRIFWVEDGSFDTTDDLEFLGFISDEGAQITDDLLTIRATDIMSRFRKVKFPARRLDDEDAAGHSQGKLIPMFYGDNMYRGDRYMPVLTKSIPGDGPYSNGDAVFFKFVDTENSDGDELLAVDRLDSQHNEPCPGSNPDTDGRSWLIASKDIAEDIVWNTILVNPAYRLITKNMTQNDDLAKAEFRVKHNDPITVSRVKFITENDEDINLTVHKETNVTGSTNEYHRLPHPNHRESCFMGPPSNKSGPTIVEEFDVQNDHMFSDGMSGFNSFLAADILANSRDTTPAANKRIAKKPGEVALHMMFGKVGMPGELFDHLTFLTEANGGTAAPDNLQDSIPSEVFGYLSTTKALQDWLGFLLFEFGLVLTVKKGKLMLKRFQPFGDISDSVFSVTDKNSIGFKLLPNRFAKFFNRIEFLTPGHPMDIDFGRFRAVGTNQQSIDYFGDTVTEEYRGWFLEKVVKVGEGSNDPAKVFARDRAGEIANFHGARQVTAQTTIQADTANARSAVDIDPTDFVDLTHSPEDPAYVKVATVSQFIDVDSPEVVWVVGVEKNPNTWANTIKFVRFLGYDSTEIGRYTNGSPVFPASLSGEVGYGSGSAQTWNTAGWSLALKVYAFEHFGYYDLATVDPAFASVYL